MYKLLLRYWDTVNEKYSYTKVRKGSFKECMNSTLRFNPFNVKWVIIKNK